MKHLAMTFFCVTAVSHFTSAQEQNVVAGSGAFVENASGSVSWTIGEVIIETGTSGTHHATQGFHQSNIWVVGVEELVELEISVYPNPANDHINVSCPNDVKLSIYDMSGKLVAVHELVDDMTAIDVSQLSRGTYSLFFEGADHKIKTAKLVVQ